MKRRQASGKGADARRLTASLISRLRPRQEARDLTLLMTIYKCGERAGKVRAGIDRIEFARLDQRSDDCPVLCSSIMAREECVLPVQRNRPDSSLNAVVVDLDAAVDQE